MMKILFISLFTLSLVACGSISSLEKQNLVPYAKVNVSDSLSVTGRLLDENEISLTIAVDGVSQEYQKSSIMSYMKIMRPDERLMTENIVTNTSKIASNTAFFVALAVVSLIGVIAAAN